MRYLPNTDSDLLLMLDEIGAQSVDRLFESIPADARIDGLMDLPPAMAEIELKRHITSLARKNMPFSRRKTFLGAGAYEHFIPAAVGTIVNRAEFLTAYTPYQPELSQGTLQAIYEFQTYIAMITGMDVANASMYDGASATAEAALMAMRVTKRSKIVVSNLLHPHYRMALDTYTKHVGAKIVALPQDEISAGRADAAMIEAAVDDKTACIILQSPNFFGAIGNFVPVSATAKSYGAMSVAVVVEPMSLGLLVPPGEQGADIVAGDAQSLGNPVSYGGPHVGFFAVRTEHIRQMPGRLVGRTKDRNGRDGFVLTLAAREQHIRRSKATSNICSNQALCALTSTVYLGLLGRNGYRNVALSNARNANYLQEQLESIPGVAIPFETETFNEFVITTPLKPKTLYKKMAAKGFAPGLPIGKYFPKHKNLANAILVCATEENLKADMDGYAECLRKILS